MSHRAVLLAARELELAEAVMRRGGADVAGIAWHHIAALFAASPLKAMKARMAGRSSDSGRARA